MISSGTQRKVPYSRRDIYPDFPYKFDVSRRFAPRDEPDGVGSFSNTDNVSYTGRSLSRFSAGSQVAAERKEYTVTILDLLGDVGSLIFYLLDVATDIRLAVLYFTMSSVCHDPAYFDWFVLTLLFILLPSIIMAAFSCFWYLADFKYIPQYSDRRLWWARFFFTAIQLGPVWRYGEVIYWGIQARHSVSVILKQYYYMNRIFENTDTCMLRLMEVFLESVPQIMLQLYIMVRLPTLPPCAIAPGDDAVCRLIGLLPSQLDCVVTLQVISVSASLLSAGWSLCAYTQSLRRSLKHKLTLAWYACAVMFCWQTCILISRVLAITLFATAFPWYAIFAIMGMHFVVMFIWILTQDSLFCESRAGEFFFKLVTAAIYSVTFLNLLEGRTRWRYLFYYLICAAENIVLITVWYIAKESAPSWLDQPALLTCLISFLLGLLSQLLYYSCLHPAARSARDQPDGVEEKRVATVSKATTSKPKGRGPIQSTSSFVFRSSCLPPELLANVELDKKVLWPGQTNTLSTHGGDSRKSVSRSMEHLSRERVNSSYDNLFISQPVVSALPTGRPYSGAPAGDVPIERPRNYADIPTGRHYIGASTGDVPVPIGRPRNHAANGDVPTGWSYSDAPAAGAPVGRSLSGVLPPPGIPGASVITRPHQRIPGSRGVYHVNPGGYP